MKSILTNVLSIPVSMVNVKMVLPNIIAFVNQDGKARIARLKSMNAQDINRAPMDLAQVRQSPFLLQVS